MAKAAHPWFARIWKAFDVSIGKLARERNLTVEPDFNQYYQVSTTAFWNWLMLRQTRDAMWKVTNRLVRPWELSASQYIVLSMLCSAKRPVKQSDLARWLFLEQNTISGLVDRMERRGLIHRERSLKDRRQVIMHPTDVGRDVAQRAHKVIRDIYEDFLSSVSVEEQHCLRDILVKLRSTAFGYLNISVAEMDSTIWSDTTEDQGCGAVGSPSPYPSSHQDVAPAPQGITGRGRAENGDSSLWARIIRKGGRPVRARDNG